MTGDWISADTPPPAGSKVLAWCKHIGQTTAWYWGADNTGKIPSPATNGWCLMDITHWQELPADPEGAELIGKKK